MRGYRVGAVAEYDACKIIAFEVQELGNEHVLTDAAKVLNTEPTLSNVNRILRERFGPHVKAVWLCDTKRDAERNYGRLGDGAHGIVLPNNALVISDLGEQGKLWVCSGELACH